MQLKLGEMALDKVACLEIYFKKKIVDFGDPARLRSMLLCFDRIYVTTLLAFIRMGEVAEQEHANIQDLSQTSGQAKVGKACGSMTSYEACE